jgi:hypothetical protein
MIDWKDIVGIFLVITLLLAIVIGASVGISMFFEKRQCSTLQSLNPSYDFKWVLWGGCMVKTPAGYWMDADNYFTVENVK